MSDGVIVDKECVCSECKSACQSKPGWFMPGEAEKVAEHLGVSFEELFKTKLSVDWWEAGTEIDEHVFLLSPTVIGGNPGEEFDSNPNGQCVFYVEGACSIHEVKPFECRELMHDSWEITHERHLGVAKAWNTDEDQTQVETLLGCEPFASLGYSSLFGF